MTTGVTSTIFTGTSNGTFSDRLFLLTTNLCALRQSYAKTFSKYSVKVSKHSSYKTEECSLLIFPENRARVRAISANSKGDVNNRGMEPNGTMIESVLFENSWRQEATDPIVS
uniref:Uncharacterized protein n=1 Tax=Vespula pensylvanica TaxID=30213 RepID=A0A834JQM6_VESPE|nr:hypothetical protein H0235_018215 [Vespula pensylvanica]